MRLASRPRDGGVTAEGGDLIVLRVGWGALAETWCQTRE